MEDNTAFGGLDIYPQGVYSSYRKEYRRDKGDIVMAECCCRTKTRTDEEKKLLQNRLSRIEGQIRGICRMIDDEAYCIDVITQINAVSGALKSLTKIILDEHIRTCVADDVRNGSNDKLEELTVTLSKLMN